MAKKKKIEEPAKVSKSWIIRVRYEFEGDIVVDAETPEEALKQVGSADIEGNGGSLINWEATGKPRENL